MPTYSFAVDRWTDALFSRAPTYADQVERYDTLPSVFFANTRDDDRARQIAALPGVRSFRASSLGIRRVVWGINEQVMIAAMHRAKEAMRPNGVANAAEFWRESGEPKQPTLRAVGGHPTWGWDDDRVLPTRLCVVGALNISLERTEPIPYDPDDPVCLAITDASSHLPVVVAAGNLKPGQVDRRMFGWVTAPAVISVGATTADGSAIATYSRIGDPDQDLAGPTVVANGLDESGQVGTSFAAPVATTQLACLAAALLLVRSGGLQLAANSVEGVPLVGRCFVDINGLPGSGQHGALVEDFAERRRKLPCLPVIETDTTGVSSLLAATGGAQSPFLELPNPDALRRLLVASATPVPDALPHEAGAGEVSSANTERFLSTLTARRLATALGIDVNAGAAASGWDARLFDESLLPEFLRGARESMLGWANDIQLFVDGDPKPIFVEQKPLRG